MTEEEREIQKIRAIDRAKAILQEHFDTAVIIAIANIPGDRTIRVSKYFGGVYACIGMADVWKQKILSFLNDDDEGD